MWSTQPVAFDVWRPTSPKLLKDVDLDEVLLHCGMRESDDVDIISPTGGSIYVQTKRIEARFFEDHVQLFPDVTLSHFLASLDDRLQRACQYKRTASEPVLTLDQWKGWFVDDHRQEERQPPIGQKVVGKLILKLSGITRKEHDRSYRLNIHPYQWKQLC